jgi:pimeloyl-ACP methyl ester carboxylesterase
MSSQVIVTNRPIESTAGSTADFVIDRVVSRAGTAIEYRRLGEGPGIVMLHGAMESAGSHMGLARALADRFTVYLPQRRGHSLEGPLRSGYGMRQEVDDLLSLVEKTGASNVFGVSAGGLIALQAALESDAIRRVAVYEPALVIDGSAAMSEFLPRLDRELRDGRFAPALVTGMQAARLGPAIFNLVPRRLLERLVAMSVRSEEKSARPGDVTMRMLAPTLHYDFVLVGEMTGQQGRFAALRADVLLLGGSRSPAYLRAALDALKRIIPNAGRVEFAGLDHGGSSDRSTTNRAGKPEVVAEELRRFFG